jgi:hypothetical protein
MIPPFDSRSGNLPAGVHDASWDEVRERYGHNAARRRLLRGLRRALDDLEAAGCRVVYLDGSFVTEKEIPRDFDACWEADGVNADDLHTSLLRTRWPRRAQKHRYGGDILIADSPSEPYGPTFVEFFQRDGETGAPKGIVRIMLRGRG